MHAAPFERILVLLVAAVGIRCPAPAVAQAGAPTPIQTRGGRALSLSQRVGSPGTEVLVTASGLPALTPVHVGLGGLRSGFEALSFSLTDRFGRLQATVSIPDWAQSDRVHRFIVFDTYFRPLVSSELFTVTDSAGSAARTGRIVFREESCAALVTREEEVFTILGRLDGLRLGEEHVVRGAVSEGRACGAEASEVEPLVLTVPAAGEPD